MKGKNATIISVGNEILSGDVVDTNSTWLAKRLSTQGVAVEKIMVVGDDVEAISEVIKSCHSDFVFASFFRDDRGIRKEGWIMTDKSEHEILDVLNEAVKEFADVKIGSYPYVDREGEGKSYKLRLKLLSADPDALNRAKRWLEERIRTC